MDADLIGLFTLLVGLELILGVDNVLVIAILVSRLPEEKREYDQKLWSYFSSGCQIDYGHWWPKTRSTD